MNQMGDIETNRLILGDCVAVLDDFPDACIDLCLTDPPYGLNFMGLDWDKALPPIEAFNQIFRVLKHGALAFVMSSPRQDLMWRMGKLLEDTGFCLKQSYLDWIYKTGLPKGQNISKAIDQKLGKERTKFMIDENFLRRNPITDHKEDYSGKLKDGYEASKRFMPVSNEAKQWDGWYSIAGLKPSHEPIFMVYKPMSDKTIVDNVLRHGVGAINVDACRIPFKNEKDRKLGLSERESPSKGFETYGSRESDNFDRSNRQKIKGRFPATVLVTNKALNTGEITKSGVIEPHHKLGDKTKNIYGVFNRQTAEEKTTYGDVGDQSRYFDIDEWAKHHGILDVSKPSPPERDQGLEGRNIHPTVKPVHLMAYLVALGCPVGGVVLDPFMGSGTTPMACRMLGRYYIGIEIKEDTFHDAEKRVASVTPSLFFYDKG